MCLIFRNWSYSGFPAEPGFSHEQQVVLAAEPSLWSQHLTKYWHSRGSVHVCVANQHIYGHPQDCRQITEVISDKSSLSSHLRKCDSLSSWKKTFYVEKGRVSLSVPSFLCVKSQIISQKPLCILFGLKKMKWRDNSPAAFCNEKRTHCNCQKQMLKRPRNLIFPHQGSCCVLK